VEGGDVTVERQRKSRAFMEIVTIMGLSADLRSAETKDFDLGRDAISPGWLKITGPNLLGP
jgi:hypothetical protein